ncbi:MAG: HAD hydrolase-like protein [Ignavibacteria bacterium]|nr:HAD hydrolase-like protein [Ignavibacteria bacterium]
MKLPLLIDLDGVLRLDKEPAPHIEEFFEYLKKSKRHACILSNSTLSTANDVRQFFEFNGIHTKMPILTASEAAAMYARSRYRRVAVYCTDHIKTLFNGILDYEHPQAIIIGDYGKKWDFATMNEIFIKVHEGAEIIAMHKNRYWKTAADGKLMDVGPFVVAIEYAANKPSTLIGKPSPLYFSSALNLLGFDLSQKFLMLGDDMETDIQAAKNLGADSILIYTGKTQHPLPPDSVIKPDYEAMNLLEVIDLLEKSN